MRSQTNRTIASGTHGSPRPLAPPPVWSTRVILVGAVAGMSLPLFGCEPGAAEGLTVERLPDVEPSLPPVPTLPPPPYPVQYEDDSYSVYGLRKKQRVTMDEGVEVTGTIVEIYEPPECPRGERCEALAPHFWIADEAPGEGQELEPEQRLMVVGYAENQDAIDEAVKLAERGRYEPPPPESGMPPIPTDLAVGNKVNIQGRFARVSGSGFNSSLGLLDYDGYETLEAPGEDDG